MTYSLSRLHLFFYFIRKALASLVRGQLIKNVNRRKPVLSLQVKQISKADLCPHPHSAHPLPHNRAKLAR